MVRQKEEAAKQRHIVANQGRVAMRFRGGAMAQMRRVSPLRGLGTLMGPETWG